MPKTSSKDKFSQVARLAVTESAANTLTFAELQVGVPMFEQKGLIVHRLEFYISAQTLGYLADTGDFIRLAFTLSNTIASLDLSYPEIIDMIIFQRFEEGTPANFVWQNWPIIHDFNEMPGGGLLIPCQNLYAAIFATGASTACAGQFRVHYTYFDMSPEDYLELLQRMKVIST